MCSANYLTRTTNCVVLLITLGVAGCAGDTESVVSKSPADMTIAELGEASAAAGCEIRKLARTKEPAFKTGAERNDYLTERNEKIQLYVGALLSYPLYIRQLVIDPSAQSSGYAWCEENGFYTHVNVTYRNAPISECYLSVDGGAGIGIQWFQEARENAEYVAAVNKGLNQHCGITVDDILAEMAADPGERQRAAREEEKQKAETELDRKSVV